MAFRANIVFTAGIGGVGAIDIHDSTAAVTIVVTVIIWVRCPASGNLYCDAEASAFLASSAAILIICRDIIILAFSNKRALHCHRIRKLPKEAIIHLIAFVV